MMAVPTRVALIGVGKMGRAVDALADERGATVVARLGRGDVITRDTLGECDVAIDFSEPAAAVANIHACLAANAPLVVGTTGWWEALGDVTRAAHAAGGRLLWAANFSPGVNAMRRIVAEAGRALHEVGMAPHLVETHHAAKRDAPSGTAIALAGAASETLGTTIPITSIRVGAVPGTHELVFDGAFEQIRIVHEARDRRVFAEGALTAARWLAAVDDPGVYTMDDVLAAPGRRDGPTDEETA